MPQNFPEVWRKQVEKELTTADKAPWLEGIPELDVPVTELGAGDMGETNVIHIPTSTFEPAVLINNTTYPLNAVAYTENTLQISLDKYQPEVVTLSDDQIVGASYDKIQSATGASVRAILKKKFGKAAHAIAPASNTANSPVLLTTGDLVSGRRRLVYEDIVALRAKFDEMECEPDGLRLVLSPEHFNNILLDRRNFGDQLVNYRTGDTAPEIAGFKIYTYVNAPYYTGTTKKTYGAAPVAGDYRASFAFYAPNIAKKTGLTKQYFQAAATSPRTQTNELGYRHYFIALPMLAKYTGAIASATS